MESLKNSNENKLNKAKTTLELFETLSPLSPGNKLQLRKDQSEKNPIEYGLLKEKLPSKKVRENYNSINKMFTQVNEFILQLESKIQNVIKSQENSFIVAYKGELIEIENLLSYYKSKLKEQEEKFYLDSKIELYEKTVEWFRKEAFRSSRLCEKFQIEISNNN